MTDRQWAVLAALGSGCAAVWASSFSTLWCVIFLVLLFFSVCEAVRG